MKTLLATAVAGVLVLSIPEHSALGQCVGGACQPQYSVPQMPAPQYVPTFPEQIQGQRTINVPMRLEGITTRPQVIWERRGLFRWEPRTIQTPQPIYRFEQQGGAPQQPQQPRQGLQATTMPNVRCVGGRCYLVR